MNWIDSWPSKPVVAGSSPAGRAGFSAHVEKRGDGDCWPWCGHLTPKGYGLYSGALAHRLAFVAAGGVLPDHKTVVRHLCHNRACCNPAHLASGTPRDNCQDAVRALRHSFGTRQPGAKLDEEKARDIVRRLAAGERQIDLARAYGVSATLIRWIRDGKSWRIATGVIAKEINATLAQLRARFLRAAAKNWPSAIKWSRLYGEACASAEVAQ